ncbi:MAG: trehalose-phosphatase, partial [Pseudobdellovibrionaceae bacterium]
MIYLFSNNGLRFLESVCFTRTLFAFDFDGTLSKIVKNPDDARIHPKTLKLLKRLSQIAPVAVISGRGLSDLKEKFNPSPGFLVGNHGLEGIHIGNQKLEMFRESCEQWKKHLAQTLKKTELEGIEIEDKAFSIAIHYRKSRVKRHAKTLILEALGELTPSARVVLGKCVVNVVPTGAPHKGVALLELMLKAEAKSALYIGDDDTDEDVFALSDPGLFTIRVGKKSLSQAKFYIERQAEVNVLLERLLKFLEHDTKHKGDVHRENRRST